MPTGSRFGATNGCVHLVIYPLPAIYNLLAAKACSSVCFAKERQNPALCVMIEINNLVYRYNRKKILFNGLNMQLAGGTIYGLLGKNGAGKSSLIKNMAGLLFPTRGSCKVNGFVPAERDPAFLEQLFFIPEECVLPPVTLKELVKGYAPFYPGFSKEQFMHYLQLFQVPADAHAARLSFGQKKKVYIAFALAANTPVLIMDEPTNGLDIPSKLQFRNMVAAAGRASKLTIMSTHQIKDLDNLVQAVVILDNSEVLLSAGTAAIAQKLYFTAPGAAVTAAQVIYTAQTPAGAVSIIPNEQHTASYIDMELLFNAALANPAGLRAVFAA